MATTTTPLRAGCSLRACCAHACATRASTRCSSAGKGHWWTGRGYVRYLSDFHLWGHDALIVFPVEGEPALVVSSYAVANMVAVKRLDHRQRRRRVPGSEDAQRRSANAVSSGRGSAQSGRR